MKKVAILQSNYIPWKGYFDLINCVDEFIILDSVQYTKNDWRNRNYIKTPNGLKWITIPVNQKGCCSKNIESIEVATSTWVDKHLTLIKQNYNKTLFYDEVMGYLEEIYLECRSLTKLSHINLLFIKKISSKLDISTTIRDSSEFKVSSDRNLRLLNICKATETTHYVSGPAAKGYLDENLFNENGVSVEWMNYEGYPIYNQQFGEFVHGVSIIDLLFNVGFERSKEYITKRKNISDYV